jgi:decaprenyl-phosphate phosphoribosyltransferase
MSEPVSAPLAPPGETREPPVPVDAPAGRGPSRAGDVVRLLRPTHWTKNVLVFVAPGAAGSLVHPDLVLKALAAFAVFCAAASATYCLNDVADATSDRVHPSKRHRPVAAGRVRPAFGVAIAVPLAAAALAGGWFLAGWRMALVAVLYMALTLSYTLWLKRLSVIELVAVAAGFVLRAIAGGVAVNVPLSRWFLLVTSFGALFLVIGKRAGERKTLGPARALHRQTLSGYSSEFLRSALTLSAAGAVTTYCLWAFERGGLSHQGHHMVWIELSVAPVVTGVLYVLRLLGDGQGEAPTDLVLRDRTLQVIGLLWALLVGLGVYT